MATFGDFSFGNQIWTSGTTTTLTYNTEIRDVYGQVPKATQQPKKKTQLDWLNEEVDRMCAVARDAIAA